MKATNSWSRLKMILPSRANVFNKESWKNVNSYGPAYLR